MKVRAKMDGELQEPGAKPRKFKKGDEFDIASPVAAHQAAADGVVSIVESPKEK